MGNEKHKLSKTNSETNSEAFAPWLVLLMAEAILQQQFRNSAYSPTREAKRSVLKLWTKKAEEMGRARFTAGFWEACLHTTFIPSCEDIEKYAPAGAENAGMYKPFPQLEAPKDPVTQQQMDGLNELLGRIAEGKVIVKKAPKGERQELHEVQSKGMKLKVVDQKAEAANDK
jgi:hypothetical protein